MMNDMSGAQVARAFHAEIVGPLLAQRMPGLRYAAARLGSGSDVLGFDDETSRDHDWGCRLTLLFDSAEHLDALRELLERELPESFRGMPVRFPTSWEPAVSHNVQVETVMDFAASRLGVNPRHGLSVVDWLSLPGQSILEVTAGPVFHDGTTQLSQLRELLQWYPPAVEKYVLSSGWQRLTQWYPIIGRTADRQQDVQSRLLTARLVDDVMHLAFVLCRRWPPYRKWREAAFRDLPVAPMPLLDALTATGWREREKALTTSVEILAAVQRTLGLPTPERIVTPFWDRPYSTVDDSAPRMLFDAIADPLVARLPFGVGCVEQWVDSVDVLSYPERRASVIAAYRSWIGGAQVAHTGGA